jgi:YD repeat-containing protein
MYQDKQEQLVVENQAETYFIQKLGTKERYQFSQSRSLPELYLLTEIQDNKGFGTKLSYDSKDYLTSITDSSQNIFEVSYNDLGFIAKVTNKKQTLVQYAYTADGNLASVTDELGEKVEFTYDNHLMIKRRDKNGIAFHWRYDDEERVSHTWGDGHVLEGWIEYFPEDGYNVVINSKQSKTRYYYDENGLVNQITYGDGRNRYFTYDDKYRLTQKIEPDHQRISYDFDKFGQLTKISFSDGTSETFSYDDTGTMTHYVNRLGKEAVYNYKNRQLISATYDKKVVFEGIYSEKRLLSYLKEDDKSSELRYDNFGKLTKRVTSKGEIFSWEYDDLGNCTKYTKQKGNQTTIYTYAYDVKNRLLETRINGNVHETYSYDVHDNVLAYEKDNHKLTMTYDKLDKVTSISTTDQKFEFTYNQEGQLILARKNRQEIYKAERNEHGQIITETVNQDFRKIFDYDDCGRVEKVTDIDSSWFQVIYDQNSNVFEVKNSDGTWELYDYDNFGNITMARNILSDVHLKYDSLLNLVEEKVNYLFMGEEESTSVNYDYIGNRLSVVKLGKLTDERSFLEPCQKQRQVHLINGSKMMLSETIE